MDGFVGACAPSLGRWDWPCLCEIGGNRRVRAGRSRVALRMTERSRVGGKAPVKSADTSGAVLRLSNVLLQAGSRDLMSFEELKIMPLDRVGLVGPNGAGKSSLLRAVCGEFPIAQGTVNIMPDRTIGYLPQQAVSGSELSIWDEASSQMGRLNAAETQLRKSEAAVAEDPSMLNLQWLETATQEFEMAGGYKKDEKIGNMLTGLGFAREDWGRRCSELSGGWGMRVALARLLLSEPDVLLLDEPTNHLDMRTKAYLRSFLKAYPYAVMIVSHDELLLNDVKKIVDVRGGALEFYTCNYDRFLELRAERDEQAANLREKQDMEVEKLESFIKRFGAKATKASAAQSKKKALDKVVAKLVDVPSAPDVRKVKLNLPAAPACASVCLELVGADIGWPEGPKLIEGIDLKLERGTRLAIVGRNGCGKSTLMRTMAGMLPLRGGRLQVGDERVKVGVFTQDLAADLPKDESALHYLDRRGPGRTMTEIRNVLGSLGLSGDAALRDIAYLSGGEKARVALASFVLGSYNVLMFDEPSNHLDAGTVEVLIDALASFDGAMVLVSHDRRLVERIATTVLVVHGPTETKLYETPSEEALSLVADVGTAETSSNMLLAGRSKEAEAVPSDEDAKELKRLRREADQARRKMPTLESKISKLEVDISELDDEMLQVGDKPARVADLLKERKALEEKLDKLYAEYDACDMLLSSMSG